MNNDWIDWAGGACPVADGSKVDVKHRDGDVFLSNTAGLESESETDGFAEDWSVSGNHSHPGDIVAYRVANDS